VGEETVVEAEVVEQTERPWLWKPGQSGNPRGRPRKGNAVAELLRDALEKIPEAERVLAEKSGRKARILAEIIRERLELEIIKGNLKAIELYMNRVEGKPRATLTVEGQVDHNHEHGPSQTAINILGRLHALREQRALKEADASNS
jgi:hypothetical protein